MFTNLSVGTALFTIQVYCSVYLDELVAADHGEGQVAVHLLVDLSYGLILQIDR